MPRQPINVYSQLYNYEPLSQHRMWRILEEEEFEPAWIGTQNSYGKDKIAITVTRHGNHYG